MQKNLFFLGLKDLLKALILITFLFFSVSAPLSVHAQEGGGVAGFSECSFSGVSQSNSNEAIQKCIAQILRFAFIVGIFVALFRIGFVAFNSSNPFFGGGTTADMVKALRDFAIGAFILGAPVVILNTINPTLLNLDFLGGVIDLAQNQSSQNNSANNNGGSGNQNTVISGSNATVNGQKPSDVQQAIENFNSDPTNTRSQQTIRNILTAEKTCDQPFVQNYNTCKSLEDAGFQEVLKNIPQSARETLGSNTEPPASYDAPVFATETFDLNSGIGGDNFNVTPTSDGCNLYGILYDAPGAAGKNLLIKKCNNTTSEIFDRGPNGTLIINPKQIKAGDRITEDIVSLT